MKNSTLVVMYCSVFFMLGMIFFSFLESFGIVTSDNLKTSLENPTIPIEIWIVSILAVFVLGTYLMYLMAKSLDIKKEVEK
uniref:ORF54 n=1 Tax=Nitrosopumilaceae spindle-shaped virus TaxID=3065433 RepID=A0AAT9JAG6_9VIRU